MVGGGKMTPQIDDDLLHSLYPTVKYSRGLADV